MVIAAADNHTDIRLFGRREVVGKPDCGIGTMSKLVNYSVLLTIDVSDVHGMVPSRSISGRRLQTGALEKKVARREGFHLDLGGLPGSWGSIVIVGWPGWPWRSNGRVPLHEFLGEAGTEANYAR